MTKKILQRKYRPYLLQGLAENLIGIKGLPLKWRRRLQKKWGNRLLSFQVRRGLTNLYEKQNNRISLPTITLNPKGHDVRLTPSMARGGHRTPSGLGQGGRYPLREYRPPYPSAKAGGKYGYHLNPNPDPRRGYPGQSETGAGAESAKKVYLSSALLIRGELTRLEGYKRSSLFKSQLLERKKLSLLYGNLSRKKLLQLFKEGVKGSGSPPENFLSLLERRADVALCRTGFFSTILSARQWIRHGRVFLNDQPLRAGSYTLSPGDTLSIPCRFHQFFTKLRGILPSPLGVPTRAVARASQPKGLTGAPAVAALREVEPPEGVRGFTKQPLPPSNPDPQRGYQGVQDRLLPLTNQTPSGLEGSAHPTLCNSYYPWIPRTLTPSGGIKGYEVPVLPFKSNPLPLHKLQGVEPVLPMRERQFHTRFPFLFIGKKGLASKFLINEILRSFPLLSHFSRKVVNPPGPPTHNPDPRRGYRPNPRGVGASSPLDTPSGGAHPTLYYLSAKAVALAEGSNLDPLWGYQRVQGSGEFRGDPPLGVSGLSYGINYRRQLMPLLYEEEMEERKEIGQSETGAAAYAAPCGLRVSDSRRVGGTPPFSPQEILRPSFSRRVVTLTPSGGIKGFRAIPPSGVTALPFRVLKSSKPDPVRAWVGDTPKGGAHPTPSGEKGITPLAEPGSIASFFSNKIFLQLLKLYKKTCFSLPLYRELANPDLSYRNPLIPPSGMPTLPLRRGLLKLPEGSYTVASAAPRIRSISFLDSPRGSPEVQGSAWPELPPDSRNPESTMSSRQRQQPRAVAPPKLRGAQGLELTGAQSRYGISQAKPKGSRPVPFRSTGREGEKDNYIWKPLKPTHLEVSYTHLTVIYLYNPQKIGFPALIDLETINRSFRCGI